MSSKSFTLLRRCKTPDGWKRYPVAYGKNGRVRPGWVLVAGQPVEYPTGSYVIRHFENRRTVFTPAGDSASEALDLMFRMSRKMDAKNTAEKAGLVIATQSDDTKKTLREWADLFVADAEHRQAFEAARMNRLVSSEFLKVVRKEFPAQIERADLFAYLGSLRKAGNSDRTLFNKFLRVKSWLRFAGVPVEVFPARPKFEKKLPTTYAPDDFTAILRAAEPRLRLILSVALKCGLREKEMMYLQFSDIDQQTAVLRVKGKAEYGFKVKDSEERDVPIPADLLKELNAWNAAHPGSKLLFGTQRGRPDGHLLRQLKVTARSAGLNCGHCDGCKAAHQECKEWTLHKFRRSYLTKLLRAGFDLRTVQALAGHNDLASTMRYLRPSSANETHSRLNSIDWTA